MLQVRRSDRRNLQKSNRQADALFESPAGNKGPVARMARQVQKQENMSFVYEPISQGVDEMK
jgi:hypothetical protein